MDLLTHVIMAYRLLKSCRCDAGASIYSLLPALDREPSHFHRVYAHVISNFPKILTNAIPIFHDLPLKEDGFSYCRKRINEDKDYYLSLTKTAFTLVGDDTLLDISGSKLDAGIALLSHLYFDVFNNPVQAFLPEAPYCSGHWDFWKDIGYLTFRTRFYSENVLATFRRLLLNDRRWSVNIDPHMLIKAMIIRLGSLSQPAIKHKIVYCKIREYIRFLGSDGCKNPDEELHFCKNLERRIKALIFECLAKYRTRRLRIFDIEHEDLIELEPFHNSQFDLPIMKKNHSMEAFTHE